MSYLFLLILSTIFPSFVQGRAESIKETKPLLVVVSAEWCPPCNALKRDVIKPMDEAGEFKDVIVCVLDTDKTDKYITDQVIPTKKSIPQLVMYYKKDGWKTLRVSGYDYNPEKMKNIIREMIQRTKK